MADDGMAAMARQPLERRPCPIAAALELVGERWTLVAIRELVYGVHRFDQIAAFTGASRDILTERLRKLEQLEIIERRRYSDHPPRYEYHLTDKGLELTPVLTVLGEWGTKWARPAYATTWVHVCGKVVAVDQVCRECGGPVSRATIRAVPAADRDHHQH